MVVRRPWSRGRVILGESGPSQEKFAATDGVLYLVA